VQSQAAISLTRWLVAAVFANAAYVFASWLRKPPKAVITMVWPELKVSGFPLLADPSGEEP